MDRNTHENKRSPSKDVASSAYRNWQNQYIDLVSTLPDYLLNCESEPSKDLLSEVLMRSEPYRDIYIDIGCGSGNFLLELAKQNLEGYYLGVEIRFKRAFRAAQKAKQADLKNLFLFRAKAQPLLAAFAEQTFSGIYVNFPDPWPKQRWTKHKLLNLDFLHEISRALRPDGFFRYITDHRDYFDEVCQSAHQINSFKIEYVRPEQSFEKGDSANPISEFGQLFASKNQHFHELLIKRVNDKTS